MVVSGIRDTLSAPSEDCISRRSFIKISLAGAAACLVPKPAIGEVAPAVRAELSASNESVSNLTLAEASQLVRAKKISPVELTKVCLRRIEELNPKLNAFITVTADSAVSEARQAEADIQAGHWRGPLHGIPIALKDIVDTAGVRTTAGSALFKDRIPTQDAEIVRRLKAAGAVLLDTSYPDTQILELFEGDRPELVDADHYLNATEGLAAIPEKVAEILRSRRSGTT